MNTAIVYGSSTGTTEEVAGLIRDLWVGDVAMIEICDVELDELTGYDLLIVGCPTWDIGELQSDWAEIAEDIAKKDFSGVQVVFFGLGDQSGYPDTYQDAMGMLYVEFQRAGASLGKGFTDPSGDTFEASRALIDGRFCGLAVDEDSLSQNTDARVDAWVRQLQRELAA